MLYKRERLKVSVYRFQVSAPPLAAGVYPPREGSQFDQPGNFIRVVLEFDIFRFFDASLPGHGGLFSKTRN